MKENGVYLTGEVRAIEACIVGYGDNAQTIGQIITIAVPIPYVGKAKNYSKAGNPEEWDNKTHNVETKVFYGGGVRPPMIGTQMSVTVESTGETEAERGFLADEMKENEDSE